MGKNPVKKLINYDQFWVQHIATLIRYSKSADTLELSPCCWQCQMQHKQNLFYHINMLLALPTAFTLTLKITWIGAIYDDTHTRWSWLLLLTSKSFLRLIKWDIMTNIYCYAFFTTSFVIHNVKAFYYQHCWRDSNLATLEPPRFEVFMTFSVISELQNIT